MAKVKKTKKSKLMKRLPPNWGDNLLLEDIDWTIDHFNQMIDDYTSMMQNPFLDDVQVSFAKKSLPIVQSRLVLWQNCRAYHLAGKSIMPLLREDRK